MSIGAIKKPNAEIRLGKLLSRGYLPAELPPPFTSEQFAKSAVVFARKWDGAKIRSKFWTAPESYSIPRYGEARRKHALVNPVNQLHIAPHIAHNWPDLKKRLVSSQVSESNTTFSTA